MTDHGFRAMACTLLDEELGFPPEWVEHHMAHALKDLLDWAYNRTKHLPQQKEKPLGAKAGGRVRPQSEPCNSVHLLIAFMSWRKAEH
ncbi:hypothetical protein GCM10027217_41850 [Pseudomaricurvus hydrocarbonicus]